jgi:hypothetical protein
MAAAGLGYGALQRSPTTEVESATQVEARREESMKERREETKRFEQIQGCGFHLNGLTPSDPFAGCERVGRFLYQLVGFVAPVVG